MNAATSKQSTAAPKRDGGKLIGWGWGLLIFGIAGFLLNLPDTPLLENVVIASLLGGGGAALLIHGRRKRDLCVACRRVDPQPVLFAHPADYLCPLHASQRARIEAKEREVLGGTAEGSAAEGTTAAAGWHQDPIVAGQLRYWDGSRWTEHTLPRSALTAEWRRPAHRPPSRPTHSSAGSRSIHMCSASRPAARAASASRPCIAAHVGYRIPALVDPFVGAALQEHRHCAGLVDQLLRGCHDARFRADEDPARRLRILGGADADSDDFAAHRGQVGLLGAAEGVVDLVPRVCAADHECAGPVGTSHSHGISDYRPAALHAPRRRAGALQPRPVDQPGVGVRRQLPDRQFGGAVDLRVRAALVVDRCPVGPVGPAARVRVRGRCGRRGRSRSRSASRR